MPGAAPQDSAESAVFGVESSLYVLIRIAHLAAVMTLFGAIVMRLVVAPRAARRSAVSASFAAALAHRLDRTMFSASLALAVITVVRLAAQHAALFGVGESWTGDSLGALLWHSAWGRGWCLAWLGVVAGLGGARMSGQLQRWGLLVVAMVATAVSLGYSGHPAGAPSPLIAIFVDALHVAGAGAWLGGVGGLVLIGVPLALHWREDGGHPALADLVAAFTPVALAGAALVGVSGSVAAWRNVGSVDLLLANPYGRWLLAKLAALVAAASLGAYNWRRVGPSLGDAPGTRRLRRVASLELAAMLVALLITAVLVATPLPEDFAVTRTP